MYLLQTLFNFNKNQPNLVFMILGSIFFLIGGLGLVYFLFQSLSPLLGFVESGAIACGALVVTGIILFFINHKRRPPHPEELIEKIVGSISDINLDQVLKNNAIPLSLFSLVLGIGLSQIKNLKNIPAMGKFFDHGQL